MTSAGGCCITRTTAAGGGFDQLRILNYTLGANAAGATTLATWLLDLDSSYGLYAIATFSTRQSAGLPGVIQLLFNGAARRAAGGATTAIAPSSNASTSYPSFGVVWSSPAAGSVVLRCHASGAPTANVKIAYRWTKETPP